jgi:hypothetical protein
LTPAPNHHDHKPSLRTINESNSFEAMSGSTEQSAYKLLPVTAHKAPPASDRPQFNLLIEKKIEQSRQSQHLVKHWRWETFTFLLGTAALVTIIALVLQFRNKPFEDWRLRGVQATSIIAALAQVAQSAFLVPISYRIGQLKW